MVEQRNHNPRVRGSSPCAVILIMENIKEIIFELSKGCVDILPEGELEKKVLLAKKENRPLRVKLGIDASGPYIHLGFTIPLRKLKKFQEFGHTAVLIFGDFTGKIGDPTGKNKTRPQLTDEDIKENLKNYKTQVFKILDPKKTEIRLNGEWSDKLTPQDIIKLSSKMTVARMLERDYFENRYKHKIPISLHEFLYPLFQAYDSVAVKADIELGGTDQKFNLLLGREIQQEYGQEGQIIMTTPLLEGIDGTRKMSKSYDNYVGITEKPSEIFGKLMSIPDSLIIKYMLLTTDIPQKDIDSYKDEMENGKNPKEYKMILAKKIVSMYYSENESLRCEKEFNRIFKEKGLPDFIPSIKVSSEDSSIKITQFLKKYNLTESTSQASRLIQGKGVKINDNLVENFDFVYTPKKGDVIQVGKKRFVKID